MSYMFHAWLEPDHLSEFFLHVILSCRQKILRVCEPITGHSETRTFPNTIEDDRLYIMYYMDYTDCGDQYYIIIGKTLWK